MHFLFLITLFLCDMTYICICNSYCKGDSGAMPRIVAHDGDDIYRRYLCAYCTGRLMAWWRDIGAHCTRTLRMRRTEWNGTERNGTEWNGMEQNGMERNEMKRNERPERDVACPMLHSRVSQILYAILQLNALVHEYICISFCFFVFLSKV